MGRAEPASPDADAGAIEVELVFSPAARIVERLPLRLPAGATLADALAAAGDRLPPAAAGWTMGVWGRRANAGRVLRSGDRVELYRPLTVDPKQARRLRQREHREALDRQRRLRAGRPG